ncbi:low-density lipoprotein receptor-related protein 6-like [Ruditapes philippinarum]|uniref:low-density lipoprotein receptor-related protein 6-like n=1 Tax=Ruditapes philippinarum TaxID=129788 RepID=UPI00295AB2A8|nr:low-density lipoprotein receptor-related protein 6-like [Ruditapes philippinarum]
MDFLDSENENEEKRKKRQDPTLEPASPGDKIKLFDLDMKQTIAYYVNMDNKIYARQLLLPIENEAKELITSAGGTISGIAYDAVDAGNLYWCESDTGNIFMINVNDKIVTKVNTDGVTLVKPRNILVLQAQRKLAWVAGEDGAMSIQTMNMDGTQLFDVVSGFIDIGALTIDQENQVCEQVVRDNFLLVADWTVDLIFQIDLLTNEINAIPLGDSGYLMGVLYDAENNKLIWSEFFDGQVYSMNEDGTDRKVVSDIGFSYAYRFAKDTVTGNLYYTAFSSAHIGVITPSGENIWLIDDFFWEDLQAIAVHPQKGWLYFSAIDSDSYIARANMDGSNVEKIIIGEHVQYPAGLAIDYQNDYLYWCDSSLDTVQRCNLDGEECETIVNNSKIGDEINDIVLDDKYLYYAANKKSHVVQVSLTAPYTKTEVGYNIGLGKVDTLSLYKSNNQNKQKVGGGCAGNGGLGDCSTVCLPTSTGRACACNDGIDLKPDGKTCSDIYQCTDMIKQVVNTTAGVIEIKLPATCSRLNETTCEYTCPKYYMPTIKDSSTLTCTENGWDRENSTLCEEIRCSPTIENGELDTDCEAEVGNTCDFKCNNGFQKTEEKTFCTRSGSWHKNTTEFCEKKTVQEAQKEEDTWKKTDVLLVVIICAVLVFVLCVVVAVLIHKLIQGRRRSAESGGSVAYQKEPKYLRDDLDDDRRRDSEISSGYIQPKLNNITEETVSTSMVNPLYNNEPLPAVSQHVIPKDKTVSYTDWLKQQ